MVSMDGIIADGSRFVRTFQVRLNHISFQGLWRYNHNKDVVMITPDMDDEGGGDSIG